MQYSRLADRGEGLVIFAEEKAFPRNIQRFWKNFRLDIRDFGKKKSEIKGNKENQGNLEAAVKGNSRGGLAGMVHPLPL